MVRRTVKYIGLSGQVKNMQRHEGGEGVNQAGMREKRFPGGEKKENL